jgi:dsDNA-binding SOS-regulon protein
MLRFPVTHKGDRIRKTSKTTLVVVGVALVCGLSLPFYISHDFRLTEHPTWNPTEVQVIQTRVVAVGAKDANESHPATFFYKAEAEVRYRMDGKDFDVWLPASKVTPDREELAVWLSDKKSRFATVLWNPKVSGEGEVKLKSDIGSSFSKFD